jgi:hypothetical protein
MSRKDVSPILDEDRFKSLMPRTQDLCLIVLKGHLLMEEQLQGIIDDSLKSPQLLKDARLECLQKIKLAQAIVGNNSVDGDDALWPTVIQINKIRNKFAHTLEPIGIEQSIDALIARQFDPEENFKASENARQRARYLKTIFAFVCGQLTGMRRVMQAFRQLQEAKWLKDRATSAQGAPKR